jgi:hypothetical protein
MRSVVLGVTPVFQVQVALPVTQLLPREPPEPLEAMDHLYPLPEPPLAVSWTACMVSAALDAGVTTSCGPTVMVAETLTPFASVSRTASSPPGIEPVVQVQFAPPATQLAPSVPWDVFVPTDQV